MIQEKYGLFDGQNMVDELGKTYPIPANYASKSLLLEGERLKLIISEDGSWKYKQIGPKAYKRMTAKVLEGQKVMAENRVYNILSASMSYHKLIPGDSVTIRVPFDLASTWAAVENVSPYLDREF